MLVRTSIANAIAAPGAVRPISGSYRDAARRAGASVVSVFCASPRASASGVLAVASGVVVDRNGLVVTTSEVAGRGDSMVVVLPDGTQRPARLLGADPGPGLALLKVEGTALEPIEMAGPDMAAVGDTVLAVGDGLGLGRTVTQGIISAIRSAELEEGTAPVNLIQTDASSLPGSFGGALVDTAGRLVGITLGTVGGDGVGSLAFALPAERVTKLVAQLRYAAQAKPAQPPVMLERGKFTEVSYPGGATARSTSRILSTWIPK